MQSAFSKLETLSAAPCSLFWRDLGLQILGLLGSTVCAARLLARQEYERQSKEDVLRLASRKLGGEAGVKMTTEQIASAQWVQAITSALSASLLRLDGMLAKFNDVAV
jgi:hypothetical protein